MDSSHIERQASDHQSPDTPSPMVKPTWRRGQEGDTAVKIVISPEPPVHDVKLPLGAATTTMTTTTHKRSYFQAFDALAAQDAALAQRSLGYDHDLPHDFRVPRQEKKRKDSIRDDSSSRASIVNDVPSAPSSSPPVPAAAAAAEVAKRPTIVLSTEKAAATSEEKDVQVPKELEIDGNAGFDPHRAGNDAQQPKRTYLYKGKRFEVQGDEPEEWLKDVREVPVQASRASVSSAQGRRHSKSSATPRKSTPSGVRQSPRRGSVRPDYGGEGRRKSKRHLG
jgi:hypothetical protein